MELNWALDPQRSRRALERDKAFRPYGSLYHPVPALQAILSTSILHTPPGDPLPIPGARNTLPLTRHVAHNSGAGRKLVAPFPIKPVDPGGGKFFPQDTESGRQARN